MVVVVVVTGPTGYVGTTGFVGTVGLVGAKVGVTGGATVGTFPPPTTHNPESLIKELITHT